MISNPKNLTEQLLNLAERIATEFRSVHTKIGTPVRSVNGNTPNGAGEITVDTSIHDGAVTTSKIANAAVTTEKIADGVVITQKIANGTITAPKLADGNVVTAKIANGAVTADKIADSNVTTAKIAAGAVTADKIAEGALYTYGTDDLTAGSSPLETGKLYFVYE